MSSHLGLDLDLRGKRQKPAGGVGGVGPRCTAAGRAIAAERRSGLDSASARRRLARSQFPRPPVHGIDVRAPTDTAMDTALPLNRLTVFFFFFCGVSN